MATVNSAKKRSGVSGATAEPETRHFMFDAKKTVTALRTFGKKHDAELRLETLAAYEDHLKLPSKAQPIPMPVPTPVPAPASRLSFKSSLPIRVKREAAKRINQLKRDGAKMILFPKSIQNERRVMYIDRNDQEVLLGVMRVGPVERESDQTNMSISDAGLVVSVMKGDKNLLEFAIKAPSLPATLRSPKLRDQGGLTHRLKVFQLGGGKRS